MNPLLHAHLAIELFKNEKLTKDELDHLIIGSILPDINQSGIIHYQKTHHFHAQKFFHAATNKLQQCLALGMILHGEDPHGMDYYAHKKGGFIDVHHAEILRVVRKYKKFIGKANPMTVHNVIEFSADNIIAIKHPRLLPIVFSAFKNPKIKETLEDFADFFGLSERKKHKLIVLLSNQHLLNFFANFSSLSTISRSWINFTFFMNIKKEELNFREKLKKITQFSYYSIKKKIFSKEITQMFEEVNIYLEQPLLKFVYETTKKLEILKNEYKK